jgi:hypothetical protein
MTAGGRRTSTSCSSPDDWENLPVLGPSEGRFRCLHCGCAFNPRCHHNLARAGGRQGPGWVVTWNLEKFCFCPPGRRNPRSCHVLWDRGRPDAQRWHKLGQERWKLFREARGEDW